MTAVAFNPLLRSFLPLGSLPQARFGADNPPAAASGYSAFQTALKGFIEKGQSLTLPDESQLPSTIAKPFQEALKLLSPERLTALREQGKFGLAEEISDIFYFLSVKATLQSGALTPTQFDGFMNASPSLVNSNQPAGFAKLQELASASLSTSQVQVFKSYFPVGAMDDTLSKDILTMMLVDHAVWTTRDPYRGRLYDLGKTQQKLLEETKELEEHLGRFIATPTGNLPAEVAQLKETPEGYQALSNKLVQVGQAALPAQDFTFKNLLLFALWKSTARSEFQYNYPAQPYAQIKNQAKAWEKLLEASLFLKSA